MSAWLRGKRRAWDVQSPHKITLEDFYLRWTSGELVPSLDPRLLAASCCAPSWAPCSSR